MRFITLFFALTVSAVSAFAQLNGDGYYRVQNYMSKRYVYVTDDKGSLNYQATTADMYAIRLWKNFEKASSDPATVCYIKTVDDRYDIMAQGTGIYEIIGSYVRIRTTGSGTYYAYASKEGLTKYLGDGEKADVDEGVMSGETSGQWRHWYITPITASGDNYFGVKAEISVGGSYYQPFYTSFPYSFASSGMSAYYISKVDNGMAVMKEISGTVPAETPVFIKASAAEPVNNKLNIGGEATAVSGNLLKGVYFDNSMKSHYNRTAFDPETMRMLGVMSDGSIGYITPSLDFIPANQSYLSVPSGTPSELKIVTEEEYNKYMESTPTGITLSQSAATLTEGETLTLSADITPATADKSVTWTSSNSAVATVSDAGVVTAIAAGNAVITATTSNGLSASCDVTVKSAVILATSVTLDKESFSAVEGTEFSLTATVLPENATNKTLSWASSNASIISVSQDGLVKILKEGDATVTATTTDGSNISASCLVTGLAGIEDIVNDASAYPLNVYSASGVLIKENAKADDVKALAPGLYIIGSTKLIIK